MLLRAIIIAVLVFAPLAFGQQVTQPSGSSGGAPSGAAGGSLSGTYPNPTVTNGVTAPAVIGKGQLIQGQDGARGIQANTSDLGVVKLTKGVPSAAASTDLSDTAGLVRGGAALTNANKVPVVGAAGALVEGPMSCDPAAGTCTIRATVLPIGAPITSTSGPVTVGSTSGFYFNNAAGALTYNLPPITAAMVNSSVWFCFRNLTGRTGAMTLQLPASTYADVDGANGSSAGTLGSVGGPGDSACVVVQSTTQYVAYIGTGTWTNN